MRITEVFGPGECWHSARDRLLVIRARCSEFDAHSTLSLCQTKRTSSPFFSTSPPTLPSYSLSPASLSTSLFHFHHHDTITLLSPRSSRPRCIHTSSRATRRGTHTWTGVSRTAFSLPFLFLRWGGCSRRRGGVKRVGEGRGGVDLCQIKLKPPLSPHLSLDAGHSEYGFALGIRGVSIVGDWSPTTTFPPFPHFSQKSCSLSSSLTKISSLENYSLPLDRIGSKRRIRDRAIQTGVFRYVIFELSRGIIIYDETRVNRFG